MIKHVEYAAFPMPNAFLVLYVGSWVALIYPLFADRASWCAVESETRFRYVDPLRPNSDLLCGLAVTHHHRFYIS